MQVASLTQRRVSWILCTVASIAALVVAATTPVALARHLAHRAIAPHVGGTVTMRDPQVPDCLDPQKTALGASDQIFAEVVSAPLDVNDKSKLVPDLASKVQVSHGGTWVTIFLRHGVRFSNGDPLTAADVKYSYDRALNPATKSPGTAGFLGPVKEVQVVNPYEARLIMKTPYRPLLTNLAVEYEGILDPKAVAAAGSNECQYPIGSGPFKIKNVAPAFSTVTLVRNPYHTWNTTWAHNKGAPYISTLVFKPIVSDSTAVSELLSGELDISSVPGPQLGRIEHNPNIKIHKILGQNDEWLGYNFAHKPFDNIAVRRAVAEAINRNALVKVALNKLGKPAYSPIPSTLQFYDKKSKSYAPQYNPADAQKIIAQYHATGPYTLLTFNDPTSMSSAELIQAELQQVGMKINIVPKPIADFLGPAGKGQFDLLTLGWGWPDPDVLYQFLHSSQENGNGLNFTFLKSPTLDSLIVKGRETVNSKKAAKVYADLQKYVDTNVVVDPLYTTIDVYGVRSRIQGFHIARDEDILFQDMWVNK